MRRVLGGPVTAKARASGRRELRQACPGDIGGRPSLENPRDRYGDCLALGRRTRGWLECEKRAGDASAISPRRRELEKNDHPTAGGRAKRNLGGDRAVTSARRDDRELGRRYHDARCVGRSNLGPRARTAAGGARLPGVASGRRGAGNRSARTAERHRAEKDSQVSKVAHRSVVSGHQLCSRVRRSATMRVARRAPRPKRESPIATQPSEQASPEVRARCGSPR